MFCIHCGKQLPDEAAFCFACGAKVYSDKSADPAAPAAPASDTLTTFTPPSAQEVLAVSQEAYADCGNFFIDGETMYFLTHGYNNCEHTQLWKSDLQGNNKQCILDFDKTAYAPVDFITEGDCYYMAKVDNLLLFQVEDENHDYFNYYYHLGHKTHGVIKTIPLLPYKLSQDGKYFVECRQDKREDGAIVITLKTPYEALCGKQGREIYLNERTLWTLYAEFETVQLSTDCFVYNERHALLSFYAGADYLWARIDLFNLADYAILRPAKYIFLRSGVCISEGKHVLFTDTDTYASVCVDTTDMTIRSTVPLQSSAITTYGSFAYFYAYNSEKSFLMDLKTGCLKAFNTYLKVFDTCSSKDIRHAAGGYYKYSYNSGDTKIYYLPTGELFTPFDGEYTDDNECIPPMISLSYTRDFSPAMRNPMTDENVYTCTNTSELHVATFEYLKKTNQELARKFSTSFFYRSPITLPDGKRVGFTYGHKPEYRGEKDYYYNLYELNLDGTYKFLGCGSRGGIEELKIYKKYAYWSDFAVCRYDFVTGEFLESNDEWLREEYDAVCSKVSERQL